MIQEEYVTFETAKLLKEAGFPQNDEYQYFDATDELLCAHPDECVGEVKYAVPCLSQAMHWFREEKGIFVWINGREIAKTEGIVIQYQFEVRAKEYKYDRDLRREYFVGLETVEASWYKLPTYEAAAEAGIQAACRYLIDKNKS